MLSDSSSSSSLLLPASSGDSDSSTRAVRFDSECTLIPDRAKRYKGSSYSLPLWKKRLQHAADFDTEGASTSSRASPTEETHVVFKVPIPRFISRSPSRGRSMSASPPIPKPLSPCIVNRSPSYLPLSISPRHIPGASLPVAYIHRHKDDSLQTVPLRACCAACVPITEECLKEGEKWQEKFSRGARRRRSASLDGSLPRSHFAALAVNASESPIVISSSGARSKPATFAITVDEVDKRRKSQEFTDERSRLSPRVAPAVQSPNVSYFSGPLSSPPHDRETSTSSTSLSLSASPDVSPLDARPRRPKASPIQEEDEDQLFPLPSPRRSPNNSPSISPTPSAKTSPAPSPNASTSCLSPFAAASKEKHLNANDSVIPHSLSRKPLPPSPDRDLLPPQVQRLSSVVPSALQVSLQSHPTPDVPERVRSATETPSPTTGKKPNLSPLLIASHTRAASVPVETQSSRLQEFSPMTKLRPLPIPPSLRSPTDADLQPMLSSSPLLTTSSSGTLQTPGSPGSHPHRRPHLHFHPIPIPHPHPPSISLPQLRDALVGAGADVLKGVNSMSAGFVGAV